MIGRLVYEVRLRKTIKRPNKWRWDVRYFKTTDPEFPGVETGRKHLGGDFGYERFKWQALRRIDKCMADNDYKKIWEEV